MASTFCALMTNSATPCLWAGIGNTGVISASYLLNYQPVSAYFPADTAIFLLDASSPIGAIISSGCFENNARHHDSNPLTKE